MTLSTTHDRKKRVLREVNWQRIILVVNDFVICFSLAIHNLEHFINEIYYLEELTYYVD